MGLVLPATAGSQYVSNWLVCINSTLPKPLFSLASCGNNQVEAWEAEDVRRSHSLGLPGPAWAAQGLIFISHHILLDCRLMKPNPPPTPRQLPLSLQQGQQHGEQGCLPAAGDPGTPAVSPLIRNGW